MRQLPKLYLLLSSLLFLVIVSCRISKFKNYSNDRRGISKALITPVLSSQQPSKFKATIDVLKNHLTGILIVKQTDSVATHFVFVTELGMKMFDFVYKGNRMEAAYVFEPLNKPKLIQSLMRNLNDMFLFKIINQTSERCETKNGSVFYYMDMVPREIKSIFFTADNLNHIMTQEIFNRRKKSSLINYIYNSNSQSYSQIKCTQYGLVKISIDLIAIQ